MKKPKSLDALKKMKSPKAPKMEASPDVTPAAPIGSADKKPENDYEAEGAFNDIMRAEEHKQKPDLMKRVHAKAGRHHKALKAIKSIQDIKDTYDQKFGAGAKKEGDLE